MPHRPPASESDLERGIERVLVPRDRIAARVHELATRLAEEYRGTELTILAVLTGSLIFLADLVRNMPLMMRLDVVSISSYPGAATRSQGPRFRLAPAVELAGRDVLIIDDILDSGQTLQLLVDAIAPYHPASLRTCVLLRKDRPDVDDRIEADYAGFDVPDEFVIGYGLDHDLLYRNLPDICVLRDPPGTESPEDVS
jgi:hypoxanthine phosphoribosyltransferase